MKQMNYIWKYIKGFIDEGMYTVLELKESKNLGQLVKMVTIGDRYTNQMNLEVN